MSSLSLGLTAARQGAAALPDEPRPARGGGPHYAVVTPGANPPMFEGMMDTVTLADGLSLQRVDVRDLQGAATQTQLPAGIHIALTVGGRADVSYGGYRLLLGPRADGRACGAVVALTQPAAFTRQSRRGDTERSVCLTLTHEWLQVRLGDTLPRCRSFARQHLAAHHWSASAQAVGLVQQMLAPPALDGALWRLDLESRSLSLAVEALTSLNGDTPVAAVDGLRQREHSRMKQVRELLDSGQADDMSLSQIAKAVCLSVNTLQRHFRAVWGKTVFAYLRDVRLDRARMALERDAISVTQAAFVAGYSSPANFATAFRRRYGISPGQAGRAPVERASESV